MSGPSVPVTVAVDATPLLGTPTGVGVFCAGALAGLAGRTDVVVDAFAVSWRRREGIATRVPEGIGTGQHPMPARPLHAAWSHASVPPVEWFVGRHDVVHGTNFVVPPTRRAGRVVTVHDLTVVRFPELCDRSTAGYPALVRRAVAEGAWVHTPSEFVAGEVVEHFGADPGRVRAVHHGVPLLPAGTGGAPPLPPGTGRAVVAVGTIEPRKDYPTLLAAFGELAADAANRDVALVIVGAPGWGSDAFDRSLGALPVGVRHRVAVTGYLDDAALASVIGRAGALAYPSRYEGFGFPPLQAMAAGVPVVATRAGAVPEVVGDAAVTVDPGDAAGLAGALSRVLDGGPDIEALIARGRARAAAFTWDACAAGLARLYGDVAAERGGRRR